MRYLQATIILLASFLVIGAYIAHRQAKQLDNWKGTPATLEYAYTQNLSSPTDAAANSWGSDKLILKYNFFVGNQLYSGNRLMMLDFVYFPKAPVQTLEPGEITIYFDPSNPNTSLMLIDYPRIAISILIALGTILVAIGLTLPAIIAMILKGIDDLIY